MMWLNRRGRMQGRVLHVTGVPQTPAMAALKPLLDFHDGIVAREPEASGHLALLLSRDGDCASSQADDEWAEILDLELGDPYRRVLELPRVRGRTCHPHDRTHELETPTRRHRRRSVRCCACTDRRC